MIAQVYSLLRDSDTFAAIAWLDRQQDAMAVTECYAALVKDLYGQARDVTTMLAMGRAGVQYALQRAATVEGASPEMAYALRSRAKAMTYNMAANTWPGWDEPGIEITATDLVLGHDAARANLRLAIELEKGDLPLSRAHWVIGAHNLAAGDIEAAQQSFALAARHAAAAGAPDEALLSQGFAVVGCLLATPGNARCLEQVEEIKALLAGTEHGPFFVGQLDSALRVFKRRPGGPESG